MGVTKVKISTILKRNASFCPVCEHYIITPNSSGFAFECAAGGNRNYNGAGCPLYSRRENVSYAPIRGLNA